MNAKKYHIFDYMQKNIVTIDESATYQDVLKKMIYSKTNGIIIVNAKNEIKGVISTYDLIRYLVEDKMAVTSENDEAFIKRVKDIAYSPIKNFITEKVVTINQNDSLLKAARLLTDFKIHRFPVVDDQKKLIGYINHTDMKKAIGEILEIPFIY